MRTSRVAAAVVIVALAAGTAAALSICPPAPVVPVTGPVSTERDLPTSTSHLTPSSTTAPADIVAPVDDAGAVLAEAMSAWGRFAVSGDLTEVVPWFAADGPQYRQFEEEAARLAAAPIGEPAYDVVIDDLVVTEQEESAQAAGRFVFVRTGEESQSFRWVVELRRSGGLWQVWTVRESGR